VTEAGPPSAPDEAPEAEPTHGILGRLLRALALLAVLLAIVAWAPGLDEVRRHLSGAAPGWLAVAVALEALSALSFVLLFSRFFGRVLPRRRVWELSWSELGMGSLVPASGVAGLALGAWVLHRHGRPAGWIARRSVAFFLIKSSVNFVAVAAIGVAMAVGLVGPPQPLWLTLVPAVLAAATIAAVLLLGRLQEPPIPEDAPRTRIWWVGVRRALVGGMREAIAIGRTRDVGIILGATGYWIFDNAVLWATYEAVGVVPPVSSILMGYLIGQMGGALPIPGGVGGIDLGLTGMMAAYGAPVAATAAAVLAYRVILFWLPLIVGGPAFWSLLRAMRAEESAATARAH